MSTAHLTPNGDRVFLFNESGHLILARLTPKGYQELGRTLLVEPTAGYRASGPIYVREGARQAIPAVGEVPKLLRHRLLSFRAYDTADMMVGAEVAEGRELEAMVDRLLGDEQAAYLHVHNAKPGCYNCRIDRA